MKTASMVIATMKTPVECRWCREVYDLGRVTVVSRYADCSMWRTPCCDRLADDREWKSPPDFHRLSPEERHARENGYIYFNSQGWGR